MAVVVSHRIYLLLLIEIVPLSSYRVVHVGQIFVWVVVGEEHQVVAVALRVVELIWMSRLE